MDLPENFHSAPSAPPQFRGEPLYPELLNESTNFRIKKIMDDEKLLQDEIKTRNSICKKYGRFSSLTSGIEYTLIVGDVVLGTLAATIPGVGSLVSAATFSGLGVISGAAKLVQNKLNEKKLKHFKRSVVASTTLNNLHHKISRAIVDGQISHEEFEDVQNTMNEWKIGSNRSKQPALSPETLELLSQQATEKARKDLLDHINSKKHS